MTVQHLTTAQLLGADPDDLTPIADAATLLDVHPDTVRSWLYTGKLAGARIAGRWHVILDHAADVEHATRHAPRRPRRKVPGDTLTAPLTPAQT